MSHYYPDRRVGCATCDLVVDYVHVVDESELHDTSCPNCGYATLHHYPLVGSWPSDYDVPPCQQSINNADGLTEKPPQEGGSGQSSAALP